MDTIVKELKVRGVARSSEVVLEEPGFGRVTDPETLCAVTSVSAVHLREIGDLLSAGRLERWYLVTEQQAYYVSERTGARWVAALAKR